MSRIRANKITNKAGTGAVELEKGAHLPTGIGITGAGSINVSGVITATSFHGPSQIGIQSAGTQIGAGITQLNFIGAGNTFAVSGTTVDISIAGGGGGSGAGFSTSNSGLHTTSSIGINTSALASTLTGVGNSFQGMYISNGMMIMTMLWMVIIILVLILMV